MENTGGFYLLGQLIGGIIRFIFRTGLIYPIVIIFGLYYLWQSYPEIIILGTVLLGGGVIVSRVVKQSQEDEERERREEHHRRDECERVVKFFAESLGYIAPSLITREELQDLIDKGIKPGQLSETIIKRVEDAPGGLILGYQNFQNFQINVKLPEENRVKHIYVIGKAGSGKTNFLRNLIMQDIRDGKGVGIIAPEQEMVFEEILPYIPDSRIDDVILFDPSNPNCPVFNPLLLEEGEGLDVKVDEVLTILARTIDTATPRMMELLRQALYVLMSRGNSSLLDVPKLLDPTDATLRNQIIATSQDEEVIHFWRDVYPSFPSDAHLPITTRLGRFLKPQLTRRVLCHPTHSLNFQKAMDTSKILLFSISDGVLGEQNSQLLGQLIVSKIQLATMARAKISKEERKPFYLYIDEFQTFTNAASTSYEKILSRARKYKLGLILAHQQTSQIGDLLKDILGNVTTSVCFHVSQQDAVKFSKELIKKENGELVNVAPEQILALKVGQAYCKIGQHSFLMQIPLADQNPDKSRARLVAERAMENYGTHPEQQEVPLENLYGLSVPFHNGLDANTPKTSQQAPLPVTQTKAKPKALERPPGNGKRQITPVQNPSTVVLDDNFDPGKIF
jgi:nitrogen fixation protein